ncbi:MAG: MBL fold metallo-hydrolase [Bacteroidetes bacterium]|jgi:hydroxyacylglutathione hydrolase|nr:MBL fold metallo-hydrolase [Bacteroidota bacterium]
MLFRQITDPTLAQNAYLIGCQQTGEALLVDPERDIDRYVDLAAEDNLEIVAVAETHIHADFLSGAREFADRYGVTVYLSDEGDADWKYAWAEDPAYDVRLLTDGDTFRVGHIELEAVHTPGHTPEHLSYRVTDRGGGADAPMGVISGDFVFVGDLGRPDLLESAAGQAGAQEPAARTLYASVQQFLSWPDYLQVWPGHGAGSACGKALGAVPDSTVGYEKRFNAAIDAARRGEQAFVDAILDGQPEPPLYFGRMKQLNKQGPPLLGSLPQPARLSVEELGALAGRTDVAVLDTRLDRSAFMASHLPGALYAPLNKSFPTVAGSYVEPDIPIYLIVEAGDCDAAVRTLIRIGLDDVRGYATPATFQSYAAQGGDLATIEEIDFAEIGLRHRNDTAVVDVRRQSEFAGGHLPDAIHIAHTRLLDRRDELPGGKTLLVHCQSGARSAVASALLARHGHDVIYVNGLFNHVPDERTTVAASDV